MHSDERFATVTRTFAAVRRALAELRPRVVHIHANSEISLPAYTVARASGIPVIMHVHGEIDRELSPAYLKQVRECDVVVAVSEPVATSIRRVVGREGPVQVIVNGIAPHPREILDVPADPVPLVLMVGRLEEAKGFDDVVRALAVSRFPDAEAVIIGQGAWGEVIEQVGREVGVAPRVRMLGRVEHEQVLGWMRRARVVAVPSRHTEGFSLVAAEAGLCHRPVVATRVGGLPITVDDGATGTLVGPGDVAALAAAIDAYLQSPALAEQHGDAGARRIAREFGMPAYCAALAELYGRVDQTHPRVTHA
jgi:glycogen(starch) synthase